MVMRSLFVMLISVFCFSSAIAQEMSDLRFIRQSNPIEMPPQHREIIRFDSKETSELKLFSTGLIRIYQKFISTQDRPVCNFTPSCSRFGMGVIQKYGFFRGVLLTADRLIRDNGLIMGAHYHLHPATGKYIDLVESYSREALTK